MAASGLQRRKIEVLLDKVEQLPTLPGVAHRLLGLVGAERQSRREIQLVIETDAALSARVVKLALEQGAPAASITSIDAVFGAVPIDVIAADLLSLEIADRQMLADLNLARLWRHTLATGMAAQIVASRLGTVRPEEALLAGILHDAGQLALAAVMPKSYAQVLERASANGTDLLEAERSILGVDHAVLGKRLARRWGFSESLQSVLWLHHQAQVPTVDLPGAGILAQVVRLSDLIVRQEGFSYQPSEQVRESTAEAAERLGLSGAAADQIGHQVAMAFDLNAKPAGLDAEPKLEDLWTVVSAANARLGRMYRAGYARSRQLEAQTRRADLLMHLNSQLAARHSAREVLEIVAGAAREALALGLVVPYLLGRQADYIEGIRCSADGAVEEHFLYGITKGESMDALAPDEPVSLSAGSSLARAERIEGWLFERQGVRLGEGPFYTAAMLVEGRKVGGLVFSIPSGRELTAQETAELAAIASMAGVALKRVQAEGDLVALSEELAEANRELQAAQDERLRQRNVASMGEMAAGAAHEINNPLAIISGRAQQLAADEKVPARQEILRTIVQQAGRVSDIIADLRQFARPPAPEFQKIDPVALAGEVVAGFEPRAAHGAVRVRLEAAEAAPRIRVDPQQMTGALGAVIQNAVEACSNGHGGNVVIAVQPARAEAAVRFVVSDDGPGMEPQVRARAFDPFYCGHEAGRRRGLGLSKAYRTVQANGGQMSLESSAGQGTTVRMTFPIATE